MFHSMRRQGFMVFHKERNHWGCDGYMCVEFSIVSPGVAKAEFGATHC
jgi:hypothetical protein